MDTVSHFAIISSVGDTSKDQVILILEQKSKDTAAKSIELK